MRDAPDPEEVSKTFAHWSTIGLAVIALLVVMLMPKLGDPEFVIYIDGKQPDTLPLPVDQVITNDRAQLWWSVYTAALDKNYSPQTGRDVANAAVLAVYGPAR